MNQIIKCVTHDGIFHADDVFAAMLLREYLRPARYDERNKSWYSALSDNFFNLIRSRKPEIIASADYVFDVGMVYDHETRRYDHHMNNGPMRNDGSPYSSVGLIFKHYGREVVEKTISKTASDDVIDFVFRELEGSLITHLDLVDNGIRRPFGTDISSIIGDFNVNSSDNEYDAFLDAMVFAHKVFSLKVKKLVEIFEAKDIVLEAAKNLHENHILILSKYVPYQRIIFENDLTSIFFVIFPSDNGEWRVSTVPLESGSFQFRVPLPESWGGLEKDELSQIIGIPDAVFCHKALFVGGAKSKESALKMAEIALVEYFKRQEVIQ